MQISCKIIELQPTDKNINDYQVVTFGVGWSQLCLLVDNWFKLWGELPNYYENIYMNKMNLT